MDATPPVDPTVPKPPGPPPAAPTGWLRVHRWLVGAGLGVVAVLALAVAAVALSLTLKPTVAIDRMVPATADAYVAAYIDPPLSQKLNLLGLAHRFPDLKTDADITKTVDKWLDKAFAQSGLSFSGDVRPWLGSQLDVIAVVDKTAATKTPVVAVLAVSKDDARAKAALLKLRSGAYGQAIAWSDETYQGLAISVGTPTGNAIKEPVAYAIVHHTVVLASSDALIKAIIDTDAGKQARLIERADFRATLARFPGDKLVFVYVNAKSAAKSVVDQLSGATNKSLGADLTKLNQLEAAQSIGFALIAKPTGVVADLEVKVDPSLLDAPTREALSASGNAAVMAGWVPKRAYGFAATATLKASLNALVDTLKSDAQTSKELQSYGVTGPNGVLAHLTGEAAIEVEPGEARYPAGALLIGTSDRPGMERFLQRLVDTIAPLSQSLTTQGLTVKHTTYHGATITTLVVSGLSAEGYAPSYTVTQGFAIVGSSLAEVEAVISSHETGIAVVAADNYKAASGQAVTNPSGLFYVDIAAIAAAVRPLLPASEQPNYDRTVAPDLGPLTALIMTSRGSPSSLSQLLFVLITGVGTPAPSGSAP